MTAPIPAVSLETAKQRLSEAAARCLAGGPQAAAEADAAMAEVLRLQAGNHDATPENARETVVAHE